jgi:hypothetical protein
MMTPKPGGMDAPGQGQTEPVDGLSGVRHEGGVTPAQASMRNVGTCRRDAKGLHRGVRGLVGRVRRTILSFLLVLTEPNAV